MVNDTIAAIATGLTNAGVSIIRISGEDAFSVIEKMFKMGPSGKKGFINVSKVNANSVVYGYVVDGEELIDECLVLVFKAPNSYTRENVIEIQCHGGVLVTKKVLEVVLKNGARLAEPGEFTKRAFLNGRIDLTKAEAVINLINAKNEFAARNSIKQLNGITLNTISKVRDMILTDTAFIEAALDDPEHISLDGFVDKLEEHLLTEKTIVDRLISSSKNGRIMVEGINTCIVGKPNAGKSTLLNAITGVERAIVTDIEGTTRDTLQETVSFGGITLNLIDTAGIRETKDVIEKIGVERSKDAIKDADLVLFILDGSRSLDDNDRSVYESVKDKKVIIIVNKEDVNNIIDLSQLNTDFPVINMSAKTGNGLEKLEKLIKDMFYSGEVIPNDEAIITSMRHRECLEAARTSLDNVSSSIEMGMSEDFFTIDLLAAYTSLGLIIGEETDEDLINKIFKDFCMGK